jgi:hypothetical protein
MATVSITVPNPMVARVRVAARAAFPQYAALSDVAAFQEITAVYWRQIVQSYEATIAADAARATALATATADTATIA